MKPLLPLALLFAWMGTGTFAVAADGPLPGSQLPPDKNNCGTCHGEKDLWSGDNERLYVPLDKLADDVHWKHGVNCHDCHGGDPNTLNFQVAHATEVAAGAEANVVPFRLQLSAKDRTTAKLETLVQVCGKCHAHSEDTYLASVHGHGFQESGLVVTAVCTDCHGSHGILPARDLQSRLNAANVDATCAKCHRFIDERLAKSVHGREFQRSPGTGDSIAVAKKPERKATCIDCHQGHDLPHPKSAAARQRLAGRCGNCHAELSTSYMLSVHGELTELGYVAAAKCSDCHGAHDILPVADPASRLSAANRHATCARCHEKVNANFLDFDPHSNPDNRQRDALLFWINWGLTGLLTGVFLLFGTHSLLWLIRSYPHVARHGRPKNPEPGGRAFMRFRPVHRVAHAVLMTSFLGLALTGLPLRYSSYGWAQIVSSFLGGFASTGLWHRIFGIANFSCLVFYVFWFGGLLLFGPRRTGVGRAQLVFGPDSPVPNPRDFSDFAQMVRWFFGRGSKPKFDRWTYWEKFDLWGASCDIVLIGTTGLILWFPNEFCTLVPGKVLNVADLIHGKLALLATGFVFAIHFFSANLRPEKFPMDTCIFTGLVSEHELEEERPDLVRRLREAGQLDEHFAPVPAQPAITATKIVGAFALTLGLLLLAAIVIAAL